MVTVLVPAGVEFDDPPPHPMSAPPANTRSKRESTEMFHAARKFVSARCCRRARSKPIAPSRTMHKSGVRSFGRDVGKSFRSEADATLVAIVSVVVDAALPLGVTVAGLNVQVASVGRPEHAKAMADAKPKAGVAEMVVAPVPPLAIEIEVGLRDRLKADVPTATFTAADVEAAKALSPPY
jgi:hypothetical protein